MLGLKSSGVVWAYVLTLGSALLCLVYGIRNWNRGGENEEREIEEELKWEEKEKDIEKNL